MVVEASPIGLSVSSPLVAAVEEVIYGEIVAV